MRTACGVSLHAGHPGANPNFSRDLFVMYRAFTITSGLPGTTVAGPEALMSRPVLPLVHHSVPFDGQQKFFLSHLEPSSMLVSFLFPGTLLPPSMLPLRVSCASGTPRVLQTVPTECAMVSPSSGCTVSARHILSKRYSAWCPRVPQSRPWLDVLPVRPPPRRIGRVFEKFINPAPRFTVASASPLDFSHADASSLVDQLFRTSPLARSPTVRRRVMDIVSSFVRTTRQEHDFPEPVQDLQFNTTSNTNSGSAPTDESFPTTRTL